jgi:plasmid stabilization system protein ParE
VTRRFHPEAQRELDEVAAQYEVFRERLGEEFLDELQGGLSVVLEAPTRWPPYRHGTRAYRLKRFPYRIVYRARSDEVFVVTIMHTSRDPSCFVGRLEE